MAVYHTTSERRRIPTQQEFAQRIQNFIRPRNLEGELSPDILVDDYQLRKPQVDVVDSATQALSDNKGSGLFVRPPRTGKTILFGSIAKGVDDNVLVLVPSKDLVDQTYEKFVDVIGISESDIGCLYSDVTGIRKRANEMGKKILITTFDTFRNLADERKGTGKAEITPQDRPFVIVDEVHGATGPETKPLLKYFMSQGAVVQGWTATDMFADGSTVSDALFDGDLPIHETTFYEAAKRGEIAPTRNIIFETELVSGIKGKLVNDDMSEQEARQIVRQKGRDEAAINKIMEFEDEVTHPEQGTWTNKFRDVPQIWYCVGVDHASKIADDLNEQYEAKLRSSEIKPIRGGEVSAYARTHLKKDQIDSMSFSQYAMTISGKTPKEDRYDDDGNFIPGRKTIFKAYEEGRIRSLVSADLLVEGYDFPHCELTVMLRPTKSPRIAVQAGARSTGLNPNDDNKVGYVASFVDQDSEGVAIFGEVVGGLWMAPDSFPDYSSQPGKKKESPDPDGLPKIHAVYTERERINFNERRKNVQVARSKIPTGFIHSSWFTQNPEYKKFTDNFSQRLRILIEDLERQYEQSQQSLPEEERNQTPFKTKQGVHVQLTENVSGGLTLLVHHEELEEFIDKQMRPEPLLERPPEGFVFSSEIMRDYITDQRGFFAFSDFKERALKQYYDDQLQLDRSERHKEPTPTEEGVSVLRARHGNRNDLAFNEEELHTFLEKTLKIMPKAPAPRDGFVTAGQLFRILKDERYDVTREDIEQVYFAFTEEYEKAIAKSEHSVRDGQPIMTRAGVPIAMARLYRGNQVVAPIDSAVSSGERDIKSFVIDELRLKQKERLLGKAPLKYIYTGATLESLERKLGEGARENAQSVIDALEARYNETGRIGAEVSIDSVVKGVSLRVAKARVGRTTNGLYIHRDDWADMLAMIGVRDGFAPPPLGYIELSEAATRLKASDLPDTSGVNTMLRGLVLKSEHAQQGLAPRQRFKKPTKAGTGIHIVLAETPEGLRIFFHEEELFAKAPKLLASETSKEAEAQPKVDAHTKSNGADQPTSKTEKISHMGKLIDALRKVDDLVLEEQGNKLTIKTRGTSLAGYPMVVRTKGNTAALQESNHILEGVLKDASARFGVDFAQGI